MNCSPNFTVEEANPTVARGHITPMGDGYHTAQCEITQWTTLDPSCGVAITYLFSIVYLPAFPGMNVASRLPFLAVNIIPSRGSTYGKS